jgi:hypothetical protein
MRSTRKAVVATAASLALMPLAGCGAMKGVGKATVGAVKTTGRVVTWPVRAVTGKTGKGGTAAPVVGAGTMVEPGTVVVVARPVDDGKTTKTAARPKSSSRTAPYRGETGSEIFIDGVPVDGPSQLAVTPSDAGRR